MPTRLSKPAMSAQALPRKRPLQSRAVVTVAAIVEAAAHILEKEGFANYSTNAIAERAGVSIGSLYQYFPNKDAITRALIARESRSLLDAVATVPRTGDWRTAIVGLIGVAVEHQLERPGLARLIDIEESRLSGAASDIDTAAALVALLKPIIALSGRHPEARLNDIVADILVITRALTDAAGKRREDGRAAIEQRVRRAVLGYLEFATHE